MKTQVSVVSSSSYGEIYFYLTPFYLKNCSQCKKKLYCLSFRYNNKHWKEFFVCRNCSDFPFINWDRQHYIAWWMKVNLKRRRGFVNER